MEDFNASCMPCRAAAPNMQGCCCRWASRSPLLLGLLPAPSWQLNLGGSCKGSGLNWRGTEQNNTGGAKWAPQMRARPLS
jgi:hypothetical protein